jgi:hypothetical protein
VLRWLRSFVPDPEIRSHLLREEGEVIVDEVAHHWVSFVRGGLYAVLAVLLLVWSVLTDTSFGWLPFLAGWALLAWGGYLALSVHMDRFVVTNMRVFRVNGVFSQSLATMPLARILDITVHKPFVGRVLGYGHFVFESAAQAQGLREITTVARPDERDLTIQRVVQQAGLRGGPKVN